MIYMTHLASCFFYLHPKLSEFPDNSWVRTSDLIEAHHSRIYLVSFYWALQTLLTIGYGDVLPGTTFEMNYANMWMFFGLIFYSYLFGIMTTMIKDTDKDNEMLLKDMEVLNRFRHKAKLSENVYNRIKR